MSIKREVNQVNLPALVPLFGGMDKRPRTLDRDVIIIGRARGCDIGLDAPDISTLHCILFKTPEGYRVRDCGSRTGTRVNGGMLRHNVLADGDVLQVGPFSFSVRIPPVIQAELPHLDQAGLERCQRSRRKLAQLAWRARKRLQLKGPQAAAQDQAALQRKATELREQIRQYDQRFNQLELAERDLETDRNQLKQERETHLKHVQTVESGLAKRLATADEAIQARWEEFQQRCRHEEAGGAEHARGSLAQRQQVAEQAAALEKAKAALAAQTRELQQYRDNSQHECEDIMKLQVLWAAEQAETKAILEQQRAALSQAEAALREQRSELGRMMDDLRELQGSVKKEQGVDVHVIAQENEELRHILGEYERRLGEAAVNQAPAASADLDELKGENQLLRQLLEEKDAVVDELRQKIEEARSQPQPKAVANPANLDLESYEAELNQYRQQLEADRAKMAQEIEQLQLRNEELDEATREMEMEMSKERAELGRERIRLDRLREEVRTEVERAQREAGVRESLAPVSKLREEMNQKKGAAKEDSNRLNDRLRSFRGRMTDSQSTKATE